MKSIQTFSVGWLLRVRFYHYFTETVTGTKTNNYKTGNAHVSHRLLALTKYNMFSWAVSLAATEPKLFH